MNHKARLRVAFLSTRAPFPPITGHFVRTYNILLQTAQFADVDFFGFYDKALSTTQRREVREALERVCKVVYLEPLKAERAFSGPFRTLLRSLMTGKPIVAAKYYDRGLAQALEDGMRRHSYDLVHLDMLPLAEYAPKVRGSRLLLTEHNVEHVRLRRRARAHSNVLLRGALGAEARRLRRYELEMVSRIGNCIVVSDDDRRSLSQALPQARFFVVPNGTDVEAFRPGDPGAAERNTVLWVGSLNDPYNRGAVEFFAEAVFPRLARQVPGVRWVVVGKGENAGLDRLARAFPGQVEKAGFVEDVRPFYRRAAVFVVPLLSGAGTKLKFIEGLAMGMPIVATSIGAEGIDGQPGLDYLVEDDGDEFAQAVARLLQNDMLRQEMGHRARRLAEAEYDWRGIGRRLAETYEQVMAG